MLIISIFNVISIHQWERFSYSYGCDMRMTRIHRIWACFSLLLATSFLNGCDERSYKDKQIIGNGGWDRPRQIQLLAWENSFSEAVLRGFERRYGAEVTVENFETADELIERLKAEPGKHDVVVVDDANMFTLRQTRLLRELEHNRLSNISSIDPQFLNQEFDPQNRHSVPYLWGTTLVAYRQDKVPKPPKSWSSLFESDYAGKVTFLPEKTDCVASMLFYQGIELSQVDRSQVRGAVDRILESVSSGVAEFAGMEKAAQSLRSGERWFAMMYNCDAKGVEADFPDIATYVPEEGSLLWLDCLAIARDSLNPGLAHAFLNYMMEPETAAATCIDLFSATANLEALSLVPSKLREDSTIFPTPEILQRSQFLSSQAKECFSLIGSSWWDAMESLEYARKSEDLERSKTSGDFDNKRMSEH
ncbi:MAG: spermidine/putrescine-binding protein [Verrucomicrobiales bacterium]|jgi:spermidine/putrescine-binding protein